MLRILLAISTMLTMTACEGSLSEQTWSGDFARLDGFDHTLEIGPLLKTPSQVMEFSSGETTGSWGRYTHDTDDNTSLFDETPMSGVEWRHCHDLAYCEAGSRVIESGGAFVQVTSPYGQGLLNLTLYLEPGDSDALEGAGILLFPNGSWSEGTATLNPQ